MRRILSLLFVATVAVALVAVGSPAAQAACSPPSRAGNVEFNPPGYYNYIAFGAGGGANDTSQVVGGFWNTSNPTVGNLVGAQYMGLYGYDDYWYFDIDTGQVAMTGCPDPYPTGDATVFLDNCATDTFVMWTVRQLTGPSGEFAWDFSTVTGSSSALVSAAPSPRPRVSSASRASTDLTVNYSTPNLTVAGTADGVVPGGTTTDGSVTNVAVYVRQSATRPAPVTADWTLLATLANNGDTGSHVFDCSDTAQDWWMATAMVVNGNTAPVLSCPVQIECDPNLANPVHQFKKIQRPGGTVHGHKQK